MKRINNKGFAISSLLYGLLLVAFLVVTVLMSIMASNRKNTTNLIEKIDEELSRHSNTVTEFNYTGDVQEFIVPYGMAGWYKIELWGAAAAGTIGDATTNRGSYTAGTIYLEENEHLYFYIGGTGLSSGKAFNQINSTTAKGGGASDVRLVSGGSNYADVTSANSIIMLAGGGGNGGTYSTSNYKGSDTGASYISGYGGQKTYVSGGQKYSFIGGTMFHAVNGLTGKAKIELVSRNPKASPPPKKSNLLQNVTKIKDCVTVDLGSDLNNSKELWTEVQALDIDGNNVIAQATSKSPASTGLYDGDTATKLSKTLTMTAGNGKTICAEYTLNRAYNLQEVAFFHFYHSTTTFKKEEITITSSAGTYTKTYDSTTTYIPAENAMGIRVSDVHLDNLNTIPAGNYYITLASDQGRVLTATNSTVESKLIFYEGSKRQKWTINSVGTNLYKITETEDNLALQPKETDNNGYFEEYTPVATLATYAGNTWEQWEIYHPSTSAKNDYYMIQSKSRSGYCLAATATTQNAPFRMVRCNPNDKLQTFKFYNADY